MRFCLALFLLLLPAVLHAVTIGTYETQGQRSKMEDKTTVLPDHFGPGEFLVGVFDGHGGNGCASYTQTEFPKTLSQAFANKVVDIASTLSSAFQQFDATIIARQIEITQESAHISPQKEIPRLENTDELRAFASRQRIRHSIYCPTPQNPVDAIGNSGTTASIVMQKAGKVYVAYVGDSRVLIRFKDGQHVETEDHHVSLPREKSRIEAGLTGAYIRDSNLHVLFGALLDPDLLLPPADKSTSPGSASFAFSRIADNSRSIEVTRALGDAPFKVSGDLTLGTAKALNPMHAPLSATPDILGPYDADSLDFIIVASDGLYEGTSSEAIITELITLQQEQKTSTEIAQELAEEAKQRSGDNISVVIIDFNA